MSCGRNSWFVLLSRLVYMSCGGNSWIVCLPGLGVLSCESNTWQTGTTDSY
jgi:hypothetical protein